MIIQPPELKKHHAVAVKALQEKLKPRLLNSVKGDNDKTLVDYGEYRLRIDFGYLDRNMEYG